MPRTPALGERLVLDLRVHPLWAIGATYCRTLVDGPRRTVHFKGISLQSALFAAGSRVATTIDSQTGEVWARLVVSDDGHVRFAIGLGAAWASLRTGLHRGDLGASGRTETFFLPSLSYVLAVRLGPLPVWPFMESLTAVLAPWRFPSLLSDTRVGVRIELGGGVEVVLAASFVSVQVQDLEDLWGGKPRPGKRWQQATWLAPAGEVGLSWTW